MPALVTAALFAVAVGGLVVAHQQHQAAKQAQARTAGALRANGAAMLVLLSADAGVRAYVTTGDARPLTPYQAAQGSLREASTSVARLLPGGSADAKFISQAAGYLRGDAITMMATRMSPVPAAARQAALAAAAQHIAALHAEYRSVVSDRIADGQHAVNAAHATAGTATGVAIGTGAAGAILLFLTIFAATRRTTAEDVFEVPALAGAVEDLAVAVSSSKAYADSQEHDDRVGRIAAQIAAAMGLPTVMQELILQAAPLHDVGNVAVPDHILLKPGVLTTDERAAMELHTTTGAELLGESNSAVMKMAQTISHEHHERWDGLGYPQGLVGTEIALSARIVAVADVFDALTHVRPHRRGSTIKEAVAYIVEERGAQFDPTVVDAFLQIDHRAIDAPAEAAQTEKQTSVDTHTVAL